MSLIRPFLPKRVRIVGLSILFFLIISICLHIRRTHTRTPVPELTRQPTPESPSSSTSELAGSPPVLSPVVEDVKSSALGPICAERFSDLYLEEFRQHAGAYCSPQSAADMTCFHTHKRLDGTKDSFCFGRGATFDLDRGKFNLPCSIRTLTQEEKNNGLIPFARMQRYWYETGPSHVFSKAVDFHDSHPTTEQPDNNSAVREVGDSGQEVESPPRNFLLLKREGESNLWHCLMEIFSTWMTFDILRTALDPLHSNLPYFQPDKDAQDTQVVIIDDRLDGPYFDLWTLFAHRKPIRLREIAGHPAMAKAIHNANIIVPLAGSSNPLWQDDWEVNQCTAPPTISQFSQRVLDFYNVTNTDPDRKGRPIAITFIDRTSSRALKNKTAIFDKVKLQFPHVNLESIDFAAIPFQEQLRVVQHTDILIGVHGAGLTHALFMREKTGVVVEIMPREVNFHFLRNAAALRGLGYFRVQADSVPHVDPATGVESTDTDWHIMDISIEQEQFMEVVAEALEGLKTKRVWNYDIDKP